MCVLEDDCKPDARFQTVCVLLLCWPKCILCQSNQNFITSVQNKQFILNIHKISCSWTEHRKPTFSSSRLVKQVKIWQLLLHLITQQVALLHSLITYIVRLLTFLLVYGGIIKYTTTSRAPSQAQWQATTHGLGCILICQTLDFYHKDRNCSHI